MSKGCVLVVEDDEDNLELVSFILEQAGYQVLQAKDGRQGVEVALSQHPDLILLDMSIPEIDGWMAAHQLKSDPQTASIPIIALTGHTAPGDRKRALDAGCDSYISKPLDIPQFSSVVEGYMKKRRMVD